MKKAERVLIVGTGIGGGALACALAGNGVEVVAIDNKPNVSAAGTGICLLGNTLRALDGVGVKDECLDKGVRFDKFREFDSEGNEIVAFSMGEGCGIKRPVLANILDSNAIARGAVVKKSLAVEEIIQRPDHPVFVRLTDGSESEYDLVVAADGAYSKLRDNFFGAEYRPKFANQSVWRFNVKRPESLDGFHMFRAEDGICLGFIPTSDDSCYVFNLINSDDYIRYPEDEVHLHLIDRLSTYKSPIVREAVAQIKSASDVIFRPFDISLVPAPWHRGRVVLIGDAAHAPTPQLTSGGGMAVEDAVVLAEALKTHSVDEALLAYNDRRFPRVSKIFNATVQLSRYEQDPLTNREKSAKLLSESYKFIDQSY